MADLAEQRGTATEVRKIIEDYAVPTLETLTEPMTGVDALVQLSPGGAKAVPASLFDDYRATPKFRTGTATLTAIESLIDHVNRFKDEDSTLFAVDDRQHPSITAVLDYHRSASSSLMAGCPRFGRHRSLFEFPVSDEWTAWIKDDGLMAGCPRFGRHRSLFEFPVSDEWTAWIKDDGQVFTMGQFAAFLEDRIIDVLDMIPGEDSLPEDMQRFVKTVGGSIASPSKLIELSVGLKVNERSAVKEAINLASGEAQVQFVAEHVDDAGQPLRVPGLFLIGIPVFNQGPIYRLAARLRYRKTSEGLVFFYQLWRADRTFDHSFREACERVRVETDLPLLFGTPE